MSNAADKIVVIGGGIGGLTAGLALLKRGFDVEIHEQAPELKEVGAGIQISSNGTRVLYALGLEEALERVQVLPSRRVIRHWKTGETWNWFDLGTVSTQSATGRRTSCSIGATCMAGSPTPFDAEARRGEAWTALLERGDRGRSASTPRSKRRQPSKAAYVIGADGIHSKVRACVFGADAPKFTGVCRVARARADGTAAGAARPDAATNWLGPRRPRAALPGAARRAHEFHLVHRAQRLADRIRG